MGNTDPNNKAGKEIRGQASLGGRHSNPVVTTPTIALDFSDTTQQPASHNVAPNQPRRRHPVHAAAAAASPEFIPANLEEENPSAPISSGLLVQADEGIPSPVVDLIDVVYRNLP
ncbi:dr1-associated corepressor [Dorcoceras hygrometricum]|uniref:Dr1-associated corepressor n=1 Tax=Dorcoceras hygrometricum TaxID=472368 RepID=A0A2Z7AH14_9LAMI|nr:dr1-associated corepressor [Dorcoceras hygrometricum]